MSNVLQLICSSQIEKEAATESEGAIFIEGYASTNDIDRSSDVVSPTAWKTGMDNYIKNPIILGQHDRNQPIGRMVEHRVTSKGLWIKARISAASDLYKLIKDEVITAFSIGFRPLKAVYDPQTEIFTIKELELLEISVVSIPANQNTLFTLSKSFSSQENYQSFKATFAQTSNSAKGLEAKAGNNVFFTKEINMDPKELELMLAKAAEDAASRTATAILKAQAAEKEKADAAAAEQAAFDARVKAAIKVEASGAERLMADLEKRLNEQSEQSQKSIGDLMASLKEKSDEIAAMQKSKMQFSEGRSDQVGAAEREKAVLLAKIMGKSIESTEFGRSLMTKAGPHVASATWELEVSMNMEAEVRRKLVVAPLLRAIDMKTNVMSIPVNPEAGSATWVTNAQFGTTDSPGAAQTHQLKEVTLSAYKVATREYLNLEEQEDSLLVLLPVVRDAMIRRVANAVDKAYLLGAGSGGDPVKGLSLYDATSVVVPTNTGVASVANMIALRKDLGYWGLDPADVTFVVSQEVYYDLLSDTLFQTVDKAGPQATILTGQIGMIGNSPVLVSSMFPSKAGGAATASTNIGAIAVASSNFLAGNQRGLRFDTQELVETQRKVFVASLRTGLVQVTTNQGQGVSTLRWS